LVVFLQTKTTSVKSTNTLHHQGAEIVNM